MEPLTLKRKIKPSPGAHHCVFLEIIIQGYSKEKIEVAYGRGLSFEGPVKGTIEAVTRKIQLPISSESRKPVKRC